MIAPRYTFMDFGSGTSFSVEGGSTVTVCGIQVSNASASAQKVVFIDSSSSPNTIVEVAVGPNDSENIICKFVADNGIVGTISGGTVAGLTATVFHTAGGV